MNREQWLTKFAVEAAKDIKAKTDLHLPSERYALSCGFPSKGGTRRKNKRIGECHHVANTGRKVHQLFIHPELSSAQEIGETIYHELLHAFLPAGAGHRKPFSQAAKKIGLEGKPTATYAGPELLQRIEKIADELGDYPHEQLTGGYGGPKQDARMLKVMCPLCGFIIRTTAKWIEEVGLPDCPQCHVPMEEAEAGEQATDPLFSTEGIQRFRLKATDGKGFDPRWEVQVNRGLKDTNWFIIDYGEPYVAADPEAYKRIVGETDEQPKMAVLGDPQVRVTPAETRQDAIALIESLREGTWTYEQLETRDDDPELEVDDPFYEDELEESADYEDGELDEEESALWEAETAKREGRS